VVRHNIYSSVLGRVARDSSKPSLKNQKPSLKNQKPSLKKFNNKYIL
jgi:hypothetical protein